MRRYTWVGAVVAGALVAWGCSGKSPGGAGTVGTGGGSATTGGTSGAGGTGGATPAGTGGVGGSGGSGGAGGSGGVATTGGTGGMGGGGGAGGTAAAGGTGGTEHLPCEDAVDNREACPVCANDATCDAPKYTDNKDGTISSSCCGLVWQQAVDLEKQALVWAGVKPYCAGLTLAGGGWRLPTKDELFSLVVLGGMPAIDTSVFPGTPEDRGFWSSTPVRSSVGTRFWEVWFMVPGFADDAASTTGATRLYVRCVR